MPVTDPITEKEFCEYCQFSYVNFCPACPERGPHLYLRCRQGCKQPEACRQFREKPRRADPVIPFGAFCGSVRE